VARIVSERFEYGRNFCNKLWNACRFAFMNLEGYTVGPVKESDLQVEDRWVLSRLATTVREVTTMLDRYQFDQATRAVREFTWNEFCDWYLEMLKPRFRNEAARPVAQRCLVVVVDTLLRLLHPFAPFITEELWHLFAQFAPCDRRGLPAVTACLVSQCQLQKASWSPSGRRCRSMPLMNLWRSVSSDCRKRSLRFAMCDRFTGSLREHR
jgi:valyl-tRNA synthetase